MSVPEYLRREYLPPEWLEAEEYYINVLRKDPEWMKAHEGKQVVIIGQEVVATQGREENTGEFLFRVRG